MPEIDLSIVIPALNEEDNIRRCLESVFKATEAIESEIILVDSGSSDKTVEIASEFPIRIFQLKEDWPKSVGAAVYTGILKADSSSRYIQYVESDTEVEREWFEEAISFLGTQPADVAGVAGQWVQKRRSDNIVYEWQTTVEKTTQSADGTLGGPVLFRSEILQQHNYNPFLPGSVDIDLGFRLQAREYQIIRLPNTMLKHYDQEISVWGYLRKVYRRYGIGSGLALRYVITADRDVSKAYLRSRINRLIIAFWICTVFIGLLLLLLGFPLVFFGSLLLSALFLIRSIIARKSIKLGVFGFVRYFFWGAGFIRGLLKHPIPVEQFPTNPRVIKA